MHGRLKRLCLGLLILLAAGPSVWAADVLFNPASVTSFSLPNGLKVVIRQDRSRPIAALNLCVRAGSRDDPADASGMSRLLAGVLLSRESGPEQVAQELGGTANSSTLADFTELEISVAGRFFPQALSALAQAAVTPELSEDDFEREKQVALSRVRREEGMPPAALARLVQEAAYRRHPYRQPPSGTSEGISRITYQQLARFHRSRYLPNNASLVVVGAADPGQAIPMIRQAFGKWARGSPPARKAEVEPPLTVIRTATQQMKTDQAYLAVCFPAPGMREPEEVCATDLLLTLLGEGEDSPLARAVRPAGPDVRHQAYSVRADFLTQRDPGLFIITAACSPDRVEAVKNALLAEVQRRRTHAVTGEELARAKLLLETNFARSNDSYLGQAETLAFYEGIASHQFTFRYLDMVRSVTEEGVEQAARKYLNPSAYVLAVVGPAEAGEEKVAY